MTIPKLHHYVPQFYLRRFVDRDGYLWVWDKKTDRVFRTRPKSIAAESNFYKLFEFADAGADPMTMERHLSELEADVAIITDQWLGWLKDRPPNKKIPIPKTNRWLVSMYISLQFFRTADTKDIICRLESSVFDKQVPDTHRYGLYATYLSNLDVVRKSLTDDEQTEVPEKRASQMSDEEKTRAHTKFLYDPNFVVLLADRIDRSIWIFGRNRSGSPFITSHRMWLKAGLLTPGAYAVFPLSPEIMLYCHDRVAPFDELTKFDRSVSPVEFDASLVEQDNTGQVFMAGRFVISSVNDFASVRAFARTIGTDEYAPPDLRGLFRMRRCD